MLKCEMRHRGLGLRLLFCYVYVYVYACDPIRPRKCGTDPNCTTFVNVVHVHVTCYDYFVIGPAVFP